MTGSTKATRESVSIDPIIVDGFMLPDGSYRMSLSQAAECVGLTARIAFDFLESKAFKSLVSQDLRFRFLRWKTRGDRL